MLSSIHPLGERAKNQRFAVTATAHVAGALAGGAAIGAALGGLGALCAKAGVGVPARLVAVTAVSLAALAIDGATWPRWLWRPLRQVDENWLNAYRGWVYGAGYGLQLGLGITTIVTAATIYALGACALASGHVVTGALIGAVFGLGRGLSVLAASRVTTPEALVEFHRRFDRRRPVGRWAAMAGDAALGATALVAFVQHWTVA